MRVRIAAEETNDDADEQELVGPGIDDRQTELQPPQADGEPDCNERQQQ
jgi:hypothetical protein